MYLTRTASVNAAQGGKGQLFWKVTGLELKLQQYVVGERFCREIHERHGIQVLNRAWERAENLPTADELRQPERWAARMGTKLG